MDFKGRSNPVFIHRSYSSTQAIKRILEKTIRINVTLKSDILILNIDIQKSIEIFYLQIAIKCNLKRYYLSKNKTETCPKLKHQEKNINETN